MKNIVYLFLFCFYIAASGSGFKGHSAIYNVNYRNYSDINNQDVAVLVVAYNRPEYLKECIKAIEQNCEAQYLPFIFALDGGADSTIDENISLVNESNIKNKIILSRDRNYGCIKNHIDSKRFAFDWCNFKKIIVLEDDVVISPSYFTFVLNLHKWASGISKNIGAVQGWTKCHDFRHKKAKNLTYVQENPKSWSFLSYCIDQIAWNKIKPIIYQFEEFIDEIPLTSEFDKARSKPGFYLREIMPRIREWVQKLVLNKASIIEPGHLQSSYEATFRKRFMSPGFLASQDVMMGFSFYMNNLIKLEPLVNRCIHIGKEGISTTEDLFNELGYNEIVLDNFEDDFTLVDFELV